MVSSHRGLQSLMGPGRQRRHRGASSVATLCPVQSLRPNKYQVTVCEGAASVRRVGPATAACEWAGRPGYMCRFMCSARWSEREKARSHRWHWKGRWPVCLR